jgi:hypothetical protein
MREALKPCDQDPVQCIIVGSFSVGKAAFITEANLSCRIGHLGLI